ncbi:MAG: UDP-N-acetylmuramoyl-L-alanyl-D-glutamate--2,6-diaminopimelate ligase [Elusimicrobia bacterium]|nr:UDP-N-acetylmuramoyl-L-alanyl-D-glutamate--2,6-diaminopimelate ligase [Elusimicrobiota bacterium]
MLHGLEVRRASGSLTGEILSLCYDSRRAAPGCLFFALPGARTDGNRFAREAIEKGAAAVMSELPQPPAPLIAARRGPGASGVIWIEVENVLEAMSRAAALFYERPSRRLTLLGVTGTNGKTTTTYLLESILARSGASAGVIGTVDYRLRGRPVEKASNTTPLSADLQRLLSQMRARGATHVAMEVSSHALSLHRVDDVDFDVAIFTNLHRDHLDYHKTPERYFEAKARLFDLLCRVDTAKKRRAAVLNADDPKTEPIKRRVVDADVVTYGFDASADVRGLSCHVGLEGTSLRLRHRTGEWLAHLKLIGRFNAANALAAAAAMLWLGHEPRKIIEGLEALSHIPGRLEPVKIRGNFRVFVDYAHTDSALRLVLENVRTLPHRRVLTVFGCGGDRDKTKRGPMGAAACDLSDLAILTSDNPRTEDPRAILYQIEEGIKSAGRQNYKIVPDRREAIAEAIRQAREGDIVLIAGKGHETYQILKDRTIAFDDREVVREILR